MTPRFAQAQVRSAPLDTTMYAGHRDWTAYTTPGMCLQAAMAVERIKRYVPGMIEDTLPYDPQRFTMSDEARGIARSCGGRFKVDKVAPADLLDLAHVALMRGADDEAWRAAERYVASFPAGEKQFEAWFAVDTMFLYARPIRLQAAEAAAARLDSFGPPAGKYRAAAHFLLLHEAERRYDVPRMEREALAEIVANLQTGDGNVNGNVIFSLLIAELFRSPDSATVLASRLLNSVGFKNTNALNALSQIITGPIGTRMPPYTASYWFGADSATKSWPVPGKVSILLQSGDNMTTAQAAMWRRLIQKFGSSLNITFVCTTKGHFRDGPPVEPSVEAAQLAKFIIEDLNVPATVAVRESPVQLLPDGRRFVGNPPPPTTEYQHIDRILTDRTGTVKLALFDISPEASGEAVLNAWVARALEH